MSASAEGNMLLELRSAHHRRSWPAIAVFTFLAPRYSILAGATIYCGF
jgi:hypothetical protein